MTQPKSNLPTTDEERSEAAMLAVLEVLFSPLSERLRLKAAALLLRYCAPPPLRKKELTVENTMDWLAALPKVLD